MKSLERECRWEGASQVALVVKNLPANAGDIRDVGLIPGSGRSPRERNANPPQYSCLENPMDSGAWQSTQSIGSQRDGHDWSNLICMHEWCWISSHVLIGYLCIIFGEMSVQVNFHDFALSHLYWFKQVNWNKLWRLDWYCGFSANKFCPQITSNFLEAVSMSTVLKITFLKREIHKSIMHLPFFFFWH